MDNNHIGRESLGQFVDELMKQRPTAAGSPEEIKEQRERMIDELDERIGRAVIDGMGEAQFAEYKRMLEDEATSEDECVAFLQSSGMDLQKVMEEAAMAFGREFLGGANV